MIYQTLYGNRRQNESKGPQRQKELEKVLGNAHQMRNGSHVEPKCWAQSGTIFDWLDGGGCSGFQYKFDFDAEKQSDDIEIIAYGVTVLVDDMSKEFLQNAELDYVEELLGSFFKVSNPNATASCGCGTSFSV